MIKTIVVVDLAGYSDTLLDLEEQLSSEASAKFNAQIQSFVDEGLRAIGQSRESVVGKNTGDGAILVFDQAEQAHCFAQGLHDAARQHNGSKRTAGAKRWFRIGGATGDIVVDVEINEFAGSSISNAVRLEGNAMIGCLLVDLATYDALPLELKRLYGEIETVKGKREETFQARRCRMNPDIPPSSSTPTDSHPSSGSPLPGSFQIVTAKGKNSKAAGRDIIEK